MLDFIVFHQFLRGSATFNDTMCEEEIDIVLGNFSEKICNIDGNETSITYHPWYTIYTLLFIYLPSVNVMATLYGPDTIGRVAKRTGIILAITGSVLAAAGFYLPSPTISIIGWFILYFGGLTSGLGWLHQHSGLLLTGDFRPSLYHYIFFIPLVVFSPIIFIFIKFMAILKPENRFLRGQTYYGSRGEAILEAAPQMGVQIYIALITMKPSLSQKLSILTSAATISLPIIENYVSARGIHFGFKAILENCCVFLPTSLFKVLSVSIICVFLNGWSIPLFMGVIFLVFACLFIIEKSCDMGASEVTKPLSIASVPFPVTLVSSDRNQQLMECIFLSWITLTSLGKSKRAAVFRSISTLLITAIYSVILTVFLVICNTNASAGYTYIIRGDGVTWSEKPFVFLQNGFYLNLILGLTICLGWVSFLLDLVTATIKFHCRASLEKSFWDCAILLEGFKNQKSSLSMVLSTMRFVTFTRVNRS